MHKRKNFPTTYNSTFSTTIQLIKKLHMHFYIVSETELLTTKSYVDITELVFFLVFSFYSVSYSLAVLVILTKISTMLDW